MSFRECDFPMAEQDFALTLDTQQFPVSPSENQI
jgi:hypothetical protein